jgi:hypothetical protein
VVGAALEVLAHTPADLVHPVEGGVRAAMAVARGDAAGRAEEARPGDHAGLDGVAHLDVEEVLLGHDAHGGGAGGEIAPEIGGGAQRLGDGRLAELADLVAVAGYDGDVAVGVHEPRHHEAIAEVEPRRARRDRRRCGGAGGGDAGAVHHDDRVSDGRGAGAVEEGAAADGAQRGHGRRYAPSAAAP